MTKSSITRPVAMVTGGRQGLGLAAARALGAQGFDVAIVDLAAPDTVSEGILTGLAGLGATARYYRLDISELEGHQSLVDRVWADFGRLDCLHNNAGIAARPLTDVLDLGPEAFDRAMDINLRGTFFLSQTVAKSMLADVSRHTDGIYRSILIVSSIAAEMVSTNRSQYCITKAGVSMLSKVLAVRLGAEGIHVHEIRPGFIRSDMTASAGTTEIDDWLEQGRVPMPRWGKPEDVGTAVASLASGALPYSTGQPFWVAGGLNVMQAT
ncbi:3-ketoacyl-ACP reductase [Citricoccus sp. NPDC055426]|uniref:3-ketoacyl-ACP reductase n=1 Tax=Citricoccus sp. NPDC055426 TaxID=3155536 RepID=UPI00343EE7E2